MCPLMIKECAKTYRGTFIFIVIFTYVLQKFMLWFAIYLKGKRGSFSER